MLACGISCSNGLQKASSRLHATVSETETITHNIISFASIDYSHMSISKKQIAGITAVALAVYSLRRWRSDAPNTDDSGFKLDEPSPTAD